MTNAKRSYRFKDVDMLIASATIIESAITNKTYLQSKRSSWRDPFFVDIKTKIDNAIKENLGIDSGADLRKATRQVNDILRNAAELLSEVKVQIEEDYKKNETKQIEILKSLGLTTFRLNKSGRNQEEMIHLLSTFASNLTNDLRNELEENGINRVTFEDLLEYNETLMTSEISQESNKSNKKVITGEIMAVFNEIYDDISSICKIARNFYKGQEMMQDRFSFSKVVENLHYHPQKNDEQKAP